MVASALHLALHLTHLDAAAAPREPALDVRRLLQRAPARLKPRHTIALGEILFRLQLLELHREFVRQRLLFFA
jgi:hypothetical protein